VNFEVRVQRNNRLLRRRAPNLDNAGFLRAHWSPSVKTLLNAGFRYQQNSQFGGIAVPEFGAQWHASHVFSLSASASRGSATPLSESCISSRAQPKSASEHEWSYEATVQARISQNVAAWTTFYYADLTNQIVTLGYYPNMTTLKQRRGHQQGRGDYAALSGIGPTGHHRLSVTRATRFLHPPTLRLCCPPTKPTSDSTSI